MRDKKNQSRQRENIQTDILPKWQAGREICQFGIQIFFLKNSLDYTDLYGILRETSVGTTTMISKKVV
jgi:hypothetical protein